MYNLMCRELIYTIKRQISTHKIHSSFSHASVKVHFIRYFATLYFVLNLKAYFIEKSNGLCNRQSLYKLSQEMDSPSVHGSQCVCLETYWGWWNFLCKSGCWGPHSWGLGSGTSCCPPSDIASARPPVWPPPSHWCSVIRGQQSGFSSLISP